MKISDDQHETTAQTSTKPVVGLAAFRRQADAPWGQTASRVMYDYYVDSVLRAGALTVLLIPVADTDVTQLLRTVDAVVIAGGEDVEPARYDAGTDPRTKPHDPERDGFEIALARAAIDTGVPLLAVCRGVQLLNVAAGGTLIQHLDDADVHDRVDVYGGYVHSVEVCPASRLGAILDTGQGANADPGSAAEPSTGFKVEVNSMHHQGIDRVAPGFTVGARHVVSGLPEAIEAPDHPFCLGVQWHPETLAARDAAQQALFDALVAAARERVRPFPATGASRNDATPAENVSQGQTNGG